MPGLNKLDYEGGYWPAKITSIYDEDILSWIERHIYLITLGPRVNGFNVLDNTFIDKENAEALSHAAEMCWKSILNKDLRNYGLFFRKSFEAQIKMFPNMVCDDIFKVIDRYKDQSYGWKLSGAGGGGYLIFIADKIIEGAIQIKIRRPS